MPLETGKTVLLLASKLMIAGDGVSDAVSASVTVPVGVTGLGVVVVVKTALAVKLGDNAEDPTGAVCAQLRAKVTEEVSTRALCSSG